MERHFNVFSVVIDILDWRPRYNLARDHRSQKHSSSSSSSSSHIFLVASDSNKRNLEWPNAGLTRQHSSPMICMGETDLSGIVSAKLTDSSSS